MATLKDVAKDAGVSIATVSCCLSGSRYVKPETRTKIMDSVEKLKYIPNAAARNLRTSTTNRIGVVLTDIDNTYHTEIFKGISAGLQRKGYTINVAFSNRLPDIECEKIEEFISQNVSGLIIITCQPHNSDFFNTHIKNFNIPTVFLEHMPDNLDTNFAGFDNNRTLYKITSALLEKGYDRIALFTGNPAFSSERDAVSGYESAFSEHGLPSEKYIIYETNMSREDTFKVSMTHLCRTPVQAIVTTSENIAFGILETLHVLGLRIPEDVQLITLSEESWNTSARYPGVIYTSRTAFTMGKEAAKLLDENIRTPALFEEKNLTFSDQLPDLATLLPPPPVPHSFIQKNSKSEGLHVLMADLATSHSAELLSVDFTRETGIPIEFEFIRHKDVMNQIKKDMDSLENQFDIFMYDVPWLEYLVQNGMLQDITDFVKSDAFHPEQFFSENLENCRHQQAYYGIPLIGGAQIMFYRQDLFENRAISKAFKNQYQISLRPPKTWTEFNGIARFFTRQYNPDSPTEFGTSFAGSMNEELAPEILPRLWAAGGRIWDKHYRICLHSPENIRAFHNILTTLEYTEGSPFDTNIQRTVSDFASGKTAMLVTYTEYAAEISTHIHKNTIGRIGYKPLPGQTPVSVGWNIGLNPFSTKAELAYRYFQWLCKTKISYYMTILDGQSPVIAPYHSHELLKLYPWLEYTEESFQYVRKRNGPFRNKSLFIPQEKIEAILCDVLKDILNNGSSVEQALAAGQSEMELLFKSYGYPRPLHFIK